MTDLDDLARLAEVARAEAMPAEGVYTNTGLAALRMFQQFATPEVVAELVERVRRAEAERDEAVSKAMVWAKSCADANERVERAEAVIAEALEFASSDWYRAGDGDVDANEIVRILSGYERTDQ